MKKTILLLAVSLLFLNAVFAGGAREPLNIIKHGEPLNAELTSMFMVDYTTEITEIDGVAVQWKETADFNSPGVIIPSGQHSLIGSPKDKGNKFPLSMDFLPGNFYRIYAYDNILHADNVTDDRDWRNEKTQLERAVSSINFSSPIVESTRPGEPVNQTVSAQTNLASLDNAVKGATNKLIANIPENTTVAVLSISSENKENASFVVEGLELHLVDSKKYVVVDRNKLDALRNEQNFQLSGDVSDDTAVSIGHLLGSNIVITGTLSVSGNVHRLSVKAIDVKTAQIVTMAIEQFR